MDMELTHDIENEKKVDLQMAEGALKEGRITIKTAALLKAVHRVASVVNNNHATVVLRNIYFSFSESGVVLRGMNDSYSVETYINKEDCVLEDDPKSILLPARQFLDMVGKISGNNTSIYVKDTFVRIKSGRTKMDITGLHVDEYPSFPQIKKGKSFDIEASGLLHMYAQTVYATSKVDSQPVLCGVCHDITDHRFRCIATDRHRFTQIYHPVTIDCEPIRSSVPTATINEVMKHLKTAEKVKVTVDDAHVIYDLDSVIIFSRVLGGTYPDTNKIIPASSEATITIPNSDFLGAVKRAAIFLDDSGSSRITMMIEGDKKQMRIKAVDTANGGMTEDIVTIKGEGGFSVSTVNGRYLLEALSKINGASHVELRITPKAPLVIKEVSSPEGDVSVVVPLKHGNDSLTSIDSFLPTYEEEADPFANRSENYAQQASETTESKEGAA